MGIRKTPWPAGVPCWAELAAPDVPAAGAFYAAVLGWEIGEPVSPSGYVMPRVGGSAAAGIAPAGAPLGGIGPFFGEPAAPHWLVYFGVSDVAAAIDAAIAAGGAVAQEPFESPYGRMAGLTDPDGALFWVVEVAADNEGSGLPERNG